MNDKLKAKPFAAKKTILLDSNIWLDEVIKSSTMWGPEQVARRNKLLAKEAYDKLWQL